jgi:cutinase
MHGTVGKLPAAIKDRIAVGVLFGDTRNKQDKNQVPDFPKEKTEIYCTKEDGVCWGSLNVTAGHFVYTVNGDGDKAIRFLKEKIDAALAKSG